MELKDLQGLTMKSVDEVNDDTIRLETVDGRSFLLTHDQGCCETVYIESIVGDLADLIGSPILLAEESTSNENPDGADPIEYQGESFTWTFYKLATIKGYVDIRWYGESNGYYSESVDFYETTTGKGG